ncbi:AbrB/MazE/SpoVT family DNA-binding domain-containing protein [Archaeoglobales archaeon]|nr:MAG: AbrB/MazE/SpoVT family DNA-binding domain-containing protein [Archaeoglobales archaeon]
MTKTCKVAKIEAVLSVDNKGQILLPKELREKANIKAGDKLVLVTGCDEKEEICCFILVKAEVLNESVKETIGPMLRGIL